MLKLFGSSATRLKQPFKSPLVKFLSIILAIYIVMWLVYAFEYVVDRKVILDYYHGVGNTYGCGGASVPIPNSGHLSIQPYSILLPPAGVFYAITTQSGGTATGVVYPLGSVDETTNQQPQCLLE